MQLSVSQSDVFVTAGLQPSSKMGARWWSCVLGLLCISAEVILSTTVTQSPSSIFLKRVNSSAEITCSTSIPGAKGFSLHRNFKGNTQIVYANLKEGIITKLTTATEFSGRIRVNPINKGQKFTLQFSLLGLEDTDVYFCSWSYLPSSRDTQLVQSGNGTLIIVRDAGPEKQCKSNILDFIFIFLSVAALVIILLFCIGAAIVRCNRFKGQFRPAREEITSRSTQPQRLSPQHAEQCPYLMTSGNALRHIM